MDKIKITPTELLQQAGEMDALGKEYDALSSSVNSLMNNVNSNWSQNLAHNFSGKLTTAQNKFVNVVGALKQGANIAKASARSYEEVDSLLAKSIIGGEGDSNVRGTAIDQISDIVNMSRTGKGVSCLACTFSADPVNLSNGNFVYERDYLQIDSSIPMSFHIFYNSNNDNKSVLGRGWLHNYEIRLRQIENQIIIERFDGSEQLFVEEDGKFECINGTFGFLTKVGTGYSLVDEQGLKWNFNEQGYFISCENIADDKVTAEYDSEFKLIKVINEVGDYFAFEYDKCNNLCYVSDMSGRGVSLQVLDGKLVSVTYNVGETVKYDYNEQGLLFQIVNGRNVTTLMNQYDEQGRVLVQTFADGGTVSYVYHDEEHSVDMVQQNGAVITYYHDAFGRNLKTEYPSGTEVRTYNKHNQLDAFVDKRGNTSFYSYDEQGNIVEYVNARKDVMSVTYNERGQVRSTSLNGELQYSVVYDECNRAVSMTDGLGATTYYEYDEKGQIISCTEPDGSSRHFEYDAYAHVKSVTNSMGGSERYEYDDLHRVVKTVDALGNATTYTYDEADRLVASVDALGYKRTYVYDASGNVTEYQDGNGGVTKAEYTVMNKVEKIIDPDGNATKYQYDLMWNLVRKINADGGEESLAYDEMNNLISVIDGEGCENKFEYDANGNMTKRTDPEGGEHKITYDELNRPIEITDPMGRVAKAEYDVHGGEACVIHPDGSKTIQEFDCLGRVISLTDRCGYELKYTYNAMGQITEIADKLGCKEKRDYYPGGLLKSVTERDGSVTIYEYDVAERIVAMINESGGKWTIEYDKLNRPVGIYADGKLAEAYEYDAEGNVVTKIDGNGGRTTYKYSAGGNMIAMVDALGYKTTYEYDGMKNLIKVVQPEFKKDEIVAINGQNRQVRETIYIRDKRGLLLEEIDAAGNKESYIYDKCGRIISRVDADGYRVDTEYYADGMTKAYHFSDGKSVLMQYDAMKQLIMLEDALGITRIVRDEKTGLPKTVTNHQDETIAYEWEEDGRRKSISFPDGKMQIYEYDNKGRLAAMRLDGKSVNYEYDNVGRLSRKCYPDGYATEYSFDKMGYICRMAHRNGDDILEEYEYSYLYPGKKAGMRRKSSQQEWSGDYSYRYDVRGSLVGVDKDGLEIEGYKYDCFGNRIYGLVNGRESRYTYNNLDQLVSMEDADGIHSYQYDLRGNLIEENLGSKPVLQMQFDATGMMAFAQSEKGTADYLYNGFGHRYEENITLDGVVTKRRFVFDITKDNRNMLFTENAGVMTDFFWDNEIVGVTNKNQVDFFMNDILSNPVRLINSKETKACQYTAFGIQECTDGSESSDWHGQAFIGYIADPVTGLYHSPRREYSSTMGRFVSKDSVSSIISVPLAYHAYHYCLGDSINYWDPTGAIWAQLGAGIVGAVAKVATKAAGDVVKTVVSSVKNGKFTPQVSPWQEYVGSAVGGFTEGVVVSTTGSFALAGAAGSAAETLTTNGLKMATGVEGYRKEDGYNLGKLAVDTVKSGATGAAAGAAGGYLFKSAGSPLKIQGINKGRNSFMAIIKSNVTKTAHGHIATWSMKTVGKGVIVFGGLGFINSTISGLNDAAKKEADGYLKGKVVDFVRDTGETIKDKLHKTWEDIKNKATCKATQ